VRLLLDAHVSGRRIGGALRAAGYDVRAADEEHALDGCADQALLALAAAEGRVLVTFNVRDFARLCAEWAEAGTPHAGCVLLVGLDHRQFGPVLRRLQATFASRPLPGDWRDRPAFVGRGS
jgi:predicted nuclease of predicted toxin-antitoxin system